MKALLLSSHTPSLFWFRVDLMKAMQAAGYEVVAAGQMPETDWTDKFKALGVTYKQISVVRNGLNPMGDLVTLKDIKRLLRNERPDKIFCIPGENYQLWRDSSKGYGYYGVLSYGSGVG